MSFSGLLWASLPLSLVSPGGELHLSRTSGRPRTPCMQRNESAVHKHHPCARHMQPYSRAERRLPRNPPFPCLPATASSTPERWVTRAVCSPISDLHTPQAHHLLTDRYAFLACRSVGIHKLRSSSGSKLGLAAEPAATASHTPDSPIRLPVHLFFFGCVLGQARVRWRTTL